MVIASTSCLLPLFRFDFSFWSFDRFGEDVDGTSETIETSPFVSVAPAVEAVDLRGMLELYEGLSHQDAARMMDWSLTCRVRLSSLCGRSSV